MTHRPLPSALVEFVTLDGYQVRTVTERAIGIVKLPERRQALIWVPRSLVKDDDTLARYDTDISVARWFAEREGLDN